jgi:hypothetical protein
VTVAVIPRAVESQSGGRNSQRRGSRPLPHPRERSAAPPWNARRCCQDRRRWARDPRVTRRNPAGLRAVMPRSATSSRRHSVVPSPLLPWLVGDTVWMVAGAPVLEEATGQVCRCQASIPRHDPSKKKGPEHQLRAPRGRIPAHATESQCADTFRSHYRSRGRNRSIRHSACPAAATNCRRCRWL